MNHPMAWAKRIQPSFGQGYRSDRIASREALETAR